MINDNNADVLLASAANKKKSERLQLISIIAVVSLALVLSIFIFLNSDTDPVSSNDSAQVVHANKNSVIPEKSFGEESSHELDMILQRYRTDIEPVLQAIPVQTLFGEKSVDIQDRVENFVRNSAKNTNFNPQLKVEVLKAEKLLESYQIEVDSALDRLKKSFEALNANGFERELANLLILAVENKEVKYWSAQKSKVMEYFEYAEKANRANVEFKIEVELEALKKIERLGFADSQSLARINELQNTVAEKRFAKHINSTIDFLSQDKLKEANNEILKASAIFPQRPQIKELKATIADELKKVEVASIIKMAEKYIALDQWQDAKQTYKKAINIIPASKIAADGYQLSTSILDVKAQLKDILNQPLRLKAVEVLDYAKSLIAKSASYSSYSESLDKARIDVKELVEVKMLPRSVWVESDGRANIRVQGVGFIRPTKGKYVNFRPGDYLFYAECKGYKTEIYRITIPLEGENLPIKVICGNSL
ncbi:MAG: hypothetical protein P8H31_08240 [Porticoccaceae bacterium]|nr:hypothetical protein [Porticoccaceae bacterium]